MSEPIGWNASRMPMQVDASLPPCTVLIRTNGEQALMDTTSAGLMRTPEFAEDLESLRESLPFVIRIDQMSDAITCECCGTEVFAVPESEWVTPRQWRRAIWESHTGRKHTMRRCQWKRSNP